MLATRAKQILENYFITRESIDINDIKEITKKKDITKIINFNNKLNIMDHIMENLKIYVYNNVYIIYDLTNKKYFIYNKEEKSLIMKSSYFGNHYKYCISTNNNFIMKYYVKNKLAIVYIFKCGRLKYAYDYFGKIKNNKYKANYRLVYI
jgi:hypothetical protein